MSYMDRLDQTRVALQQVADIWGVTQAEVQITVRAEPLLTVTIGNIKDLPDDLAEALRVLSDESIGDFVYAVRERVLSDPAFQGNSWDYPRVKSYGEACEVVARYAKGGDS